MMLRLIVLLTIVALLAPFTNALFLATEKVNNKDGLFEFEKFQLTDKVIATISSEVSDVSQYAFRGSFATTKQAPKRCKTYPDDSNWPSESTWKEFNGLLGGALIKTVPEASICYQNGSAVESAECQALTTNWGNSSLRIEDPTSIRSILFQGMTCLPPSLTAKFLDKDVGCTVGGYPEYVVNATIVAHIQLAVNFAREHNIRLVIKNTGHDFGAKSVGKGALSIWTHHLKDARFFEKYSVGTFSGPAVQLGAGMQVFEINRFAQEYEITILGGEGRTVGHIGGYTQGGGHSPLTSLWGMAADQVLCIQLVTADGRFILADTNTNADIFWAIRGGGGSTYGVVTSMVVKAFPKIKVTTMRYNMTTGGNFTQDKFWEAHGAYVDNFAYYADLGYYCYYRIRHVNGEIVHDATSWVAPNVSESDFRASVAPLFEKWEAIGVPVQPIIKEYDNYPDAWEAGFPQEAWTVTMRQASRFFPRESITDPKERISSLEAIRGVFDEGAHLIMFNIRNPPGSELIDNAVNPAWRKVLMFAIMFVTWSVNDTSSYVTELSRNLTYEWNPRWKALTPGSGTYMSESDYIEPGWQESFHAGKYARLLAVKKKWDPEGVFYAQNAVGSEDWRVDGMLLGHLPSQDSRLCRN